MRTPSAVPLVVATLLLVSTSASADPVERYLATLANRPVVQHAVASILRGARDEGLPTSYLVAKTKEGVAKRVPAPRIAQVLRKLVHDLRTTRGLVPPALASRGDVIEAGARAMMAGASPGDIRRVLTPPAGRPLPAAAAAVQLLALFTDLRGVGLDGPDASRLLTSLHTHEPGALGRGDEVVRMVRHLHTTTALSWPQTVDSVVGGLTRTRSLIDAWRHALEEHSPRGRPWTLGDLPPSAADGMSGNAAARRAVAPGQSGTSPGLSGQNPGSGGAPPGQSGSAPGQSGRTPGQGKR